MKTLSIVAFVLLVATGVCAERVCFETTGTNAVVYNDCGCVPQSDVQKALDLAVKHTELENRDYSLLSSIGVAGFVSPATETKAQRTIREAKEKLESAEREAKRLEQHDKDIQFIRDVAEKMRKCNK